MSTKFSLSPGLQPTVSEASDWRKGHTRFRSVTAPERQPEITAQELGALLRGIDLSTAKRHRRNAHNTFRFTVVFSWNGNAWLDFCPVYD
jgi:hypothetical protein